MIETTPTEAEVEAYCMTPAQLAECEREFETARRTNDNFGWDAHQYEFTWRLLAVKDADAANRLKRDQRHHLKRDQRHHQRAKTQQAKFVTKANLTKKLDRAYVIVGKFIANQLKPLQDRIAELEARPELKHLGIWREKNYKAGSLVTHKGGLWLCQKATKQRPGQSSAWTLIVKSGEAK